MMKILEFLFPKKKAKFVKFYDPLGNFSIMYPGDWHFDEDIAVVDGKYTIPFQSRNRSSIFVVAVDASLPAKFDFKKYAKKELDSPESGVYAKSKPDKFFDLPAFSKDYAFFSQGKEYFGGEIMFHAGKIVFYLSWSGPAKEKEKISKIFDHMKKTLDIGHGFIIESR